MTLDEIPVLRDGPTTAATTLVLAHGAGAGMDSDFMTAFAQRLGSRGVHVVRFEFPYMAERRARGKSRPPDREPVLRATWHRVIAACRPARLVIGGKSMGGRIASLIADEANVAGLVCLGYPFHPAGKPDQLRIEHLKSLRTPMLILQGQRDAFGSQQEVARYTLSPRIQIHWLDDGDHSFTPRKASGRTQQENWTEGIEQVLAFLQGLSQST